MQQSVQSPTFNLQMRLHTAESDVERAILAKDTNELQLRVIHLIVKRCCTSCVAPFVFLLFLDRDSSGLRCRDSGKTFRTFFSGVPVTSAPSAANAPAQEAPNNDLDSLEIPLYQGRRALNRSVFFSGYYWLDQGALTRGATVVQDLRSISEMLIVSLFGNPSRAEHSRIPDIYEYSSYVDSLCLCASDEIRHDGA